MRTAAILLFVVLTGTGGEICLTHAMKIVGEVHEFSPRAILRVMGRAFRVGWIWPGIALMAASFFAFLAMLSWFEVSFVVPATSLAYVAGAFGALFFLREHLSVTRWAGILLICAGVGLAWVDRPMDWLTPHAVIHAFRWSAMLLALAPLAFFAVSIAVAGRFFRRAHRVPPDRDAPARPISILKPLRGLDPGAYENLSSFCRQEYPSYEILFAVSDADDPIVPVVERVIAEFPEKVIRLLVTGAAEGANSKVSNLCRLVREARFDLFVISDGDVRVEADYLRGIVALFREPRVGGVTALYRGIEARQWVARLDCVGSSVAFCGAALVARELEGLRFMMGSTMAVPRARLEEIGGFEALLDLHSDDYELGRRIAARGWRVELAPEPVWMDYAPQTLGAYLRHELRWAIGIRHIRPGGHFGLLFTQGLPLVLLAAALAPSGAIAAAYLVGYAVLRFAMGWTIGVWGLRDPVVRRNLWLLPVRDALAFLVWLASFVVNRIEWRGSKFRLENGRMIAVTPRIPQA
ncbi:MAG: bacteriohopanetetrol glucosamine biosynthesis glycosyltransferase HpnI [Candidatus Acidiferrales bacterium]